MEITRKQREKLLEKLMKLTEHLADLEEDKKAMQANYNEQIKGAKKRIESVVSTVSKGDWTYLQPHFDGDEIKKLQNA